MQNYASLKQEIVKKLAVKAVRKAALAMPFLLLPGVNPVTQMAVEWLLDWVLDEGEVLAYYAVVTVQVSYETTGVKNAAANYKADPSDANKAELIRRARAHASLRPPLT